MIPAEFPSVYGGISIHWHGFPMYGEASWYDGVAYGGTFAETLRPLKRAAAPTAPALLLYLPCCCACRA